MLKVLFQREIIESTSVNLHKEKKTLIKEWAKLKNF